MTCTFAQLTLSPAGLGTWTGTLTSGGTDYPVSLDTNFPAVSDWTLTVNGTDYHPGPGSTAVPLYLSFPAITLDCGLVSVVINPGSCGGGGGGSGCTLCPDLAPLRFLTVGAFTAGSCADPSALAGTFPLTNVGDCFWQSPPLASCGGNWLYQAAYVGPAGGSPAWAVELLGPDSLTHAAWSLVSPCDLPQSLPNSYGDSFFTPPSSVVISS